MGQIDPKHAFKMGAMNGRKRREGGRRHYGQDAPNAGFPRLHTERASSTLFRRSGEHEDGTEARDRFGPIVAADATSFPPSALHLDVFVSVLIGALYSGLPYG